MSHVPQRSHSRRPIAPPRCSRSSRCVVPYDHAEIAVLDPFDGGRRGLANVGYAEHMLTHFHGPQFEDEIRSLNMHVTGYPVRMRDVPGDCLAVRTIAEVLVPAGYREGMTMCLRTSSGRETGLLNLSDVRRPASDRYRARRGVGAVLDPRERGRRDPVGAVPVVAARAGRVRHRAVPRRRRDAAGGRRDASAPRRRRPPAPPRARDHLAGRPPQHAFPVACG